MVAQKDKNVLNKFSLDEEGNLAIARWGSNTTTYTYLDENGNKLSDADKQKIAEENILEDINDLNISLYSLPINYKQYIAKYITNYGFLSDLLTTTDNVDFCEDIAQLAFNSKIVFNLKEELTTFDTYSKHVCTQTTLLYDYIKYEVSGEKEIKTPVWEQETFGTGSPSNSKTLKDDYGWTNSSLVNSSTSSAGGTMTYQWSYENVDYKLDYSFTRSGTTRWILYKKNIETTYTDLPKETNINAEGDLINLNQNHIKEEYSGYTIDEDYTRKEVFKYIIQETSHSESNKYDLDISEIDCWFLKYNREYPNPTKETQTDGMNTDRQGQFPEEFNIVIDNTSDSKQIKNDVDVQDFISEREEQYEEDYPEAKNIECEVNNLTVKQKIKTDDSVQYSSTTNIYSFGEEEADTTKVKFKNVEYINGQPSYTLKDENGNEEIGFLSIYKTYRQNGVDLYLENDAEKKFFKLLEANGQTIGIVDTMKYLLYVCDGIDRGVTNLDQTFTVIDITLISGGGISPFGTNLTREEFIAAAQEYCGADSLFADLADDFYDVCTLPQYNVNPCLAFAWAGVESGFGGSAPYNNLFGMGIGNGMSSGVKYDSYADSIEGFCKWVVNAATPGTSSYEGANSKGQEFANVNEIFQGTPERNIYVLFSRYAYLGDTHIVDEKNSYESEDARYNYYKENGSTWGAGGRIQIYYMYEHFLYTGEYSTRCTHKYGTDPTTLQEKADYAQYTVGKRVELAKDIFGNDVFLGEEGFFQELNDGYRVGIYTSRSGRQYTEWLQTTGNDVGKLPMFSSGKVMGNYGCNVYGYANLLSSTGIDVHIRDVYNTYKSRGYQDDEWTMNTVLKNNNIDAKVVRIGNNYDLFVNTLFEGRGVLTWVGSGFGQLYTSNMHWVVIADIRDSQLGSYMGYDVFVLTSNRGKGHGWQKIETIATNLRGPGTYGYGFYIND